MIFFWRVHLGHVILHQLSVIPCESARSSSAKEVLCRLLVCILLCWVQRCGESHGKRLVVNIIRLWGFTRFHHFKLITVNLTGSKIQLLLVWEHGTMKGWRTSLHPTTTSNAVVALSFCSVLAQGAKDAPRTAGDWGWHVKPQSADMPLNMLRWEGLPVTILDTVCLIWLWHYYALLMRMSEYCQCPCP